MKIIQNKVNFRQTVRIFNSNLLLEGIVPLNPSENENNRQLLLVSITYLKISVALLVQKLLSSKVSAQTKNLFDWKIKFRLTVRIFNSNFLLEGIDSLNPPENKKYRQLLLISKTYFKFSVALLVPKQSASKVDAQNEPPSQAQILFYLLFSWTPILSSNSKIYSWYHSQYAKLKVHPRV